MSWTDHLSFDKSRKAVETFGLILAGILFLFTTYQSIVNHMEFKGLATMAVLMAVSALFFPGIIRVIYYPWMIIARIIGFIVMHSLLAILFYGVVTPIGLVRRIRFNKQKAVDSYWIEKKEKPDMERMF